MLFSTPLSRWAPDPLLVLLLGLVLDAVLGELPFVFDRVPHPVVLIGKAIAFFEARLNRPERAEGVRRVRGIVTLVVLVAGALALGWAIEALLRRMSLGWAVEALLVGILVAQRSLFDRVRDVAEALGTKGLAAGREAVRHIVGRDPQSLDAHGVARAGVESLAENMSDGVVAPVFWTLLLGLPGLLAYKTVNTLDSMIGHKSERYRAFGWASARFDDLVNLVPARLTGLILCLAAAVAPNAKGMAALTTMLRDAGKHRSPNAGWPEAAMAGALGLALAGPRRYAGHVVDDPWIGGGRARVTDGDMRRALFLYALGCGLMWAAILALFVLARR